MRKGKMYVALAAAVVLTISGGNAQSSGYRSGYGLCKCRSRKRCFGNAWWES